MLKIVEERSDPSCAKACVFGVSENTRKKRWVRDLKRAHVRNLKKIEGNSDPSPAQAGFGIAERSR
jgi:hypothetical protein